jgi:hypothetical protein
MALIIPNIGLSGLYDPATSALRSVFSKMDSVVLDIDSKMNPIMGGQGMYAIAYGSADRKPKVSVKGVDIPLSAFSTLTGGANTIAASGSPIQIPMMEEYTISSAGTITLNNVLSATAITVSILGAQDGKAFTGVASAPTTGQYITPIASATSITFNTTDANKAVYISYTTDSTTGGSVSVTATSTPIAQKFIAQAKVVNTEDPNGALVPVTFVVPKCLFVGNWQVSQERQKASSTSIDLDIMDPGGNQPAILIYTAVKFAG